MNAVRFYVNRPYLYRRYVETSSIPDFTRFVFISHFFHFRFFFSFSLSLSTFVYCDCCSFVILCVCICPIHSFLFNSIHLFAFNISRFSIVCAFLRTRYSASTIVRERFFLLCIICTSHCQFFFCAKIYYRVNVRTD